MPMLAKTLMDEGYLGGRVNNNGPRTIRLNTIKDENWVGNTDIRSGNFYGLGTLAQDALTIEVNISVAGTDSSTYTQQVELSNLRFSESKPRATGPDGSFAANTEIVIQDSVSSLTIYLPTDAAEGIHNNIYYTTDLRNIVNEVNIQRTTAVNILNNREKYEAVVTECDNIFHTIEGMLTPQQQPAPAYKQEEFEAFKTEVAEKLSMQQDILMKIASELGLNKNKDGKQKG